MSIAGSSQLLLKKAEEAGGPQNMKCWVGLQGWCRDGWMVQGSTHPVQSSLLWPCHPEEKDHSSNVSWKTSVPTDHGMETVLKFIAMALVLQLHMAFIQYSSK